MLFEDVYLSRWPEGAGNGLTGSRVRVLERRVHRPTVSVGGEAIFLDGGAAASGEGRAMAARQAAGRSASVTNWSAPSPTRAEGACGLSGATRARSSRPFLRKKTLAFRALVRADVPLFRRLPKTDAPAGGERALETGATSPPSLEKVEPAVDGVFRDIGRGGLRRAHLPASYAEGRFVRGGEGSRAGTRTLDVPSFGAGLRTVSVSRARASVSRRRHAAWRAKDSCCGANVSARRGRCGALRRTEGRSRAWCASCGARTALNEVQARRIFL